MDDDDDACGPTAEFFNFAWDFDGARLDREAERQARLAGHASPHCEDVITGGDIRTDVCISDQPTFSSDTTEAEAMERKTTMKKNKSKRAGWASVARKNRVSEERRAKAKHDDEDIDRLPVASDGGVVGLPDGMTHVVSLVALSDLRVTVDGVRPVDAKHVAKVGASLVDAGRLLTALVADIAGEVIDGRHRFSFLMAKRGDPMVDILCPGGLVPVVRLDYSAGEHPERAMLDALRIAQVSRRLTGAELGAAVARLVAIYGEPRRGRPPKDTEGVYGLVATALSISTRTVARHHHKAVSPKQEKQITAKRRLLARARSALARALYALDPDQQAVAQPVLLLLDEQLGASATTSR